MAREQHNAVLRARGTTDYTYTDWIWRPAAFYLEDEREPYPTVRRSTAPRLFVAGLW